MKIVLVTGASKRIGYEVVKALLQSDESYHVFLGSSSLERGQQAVSTLRNECADSLGPRDKGCALTECPNCFNTVEAIQVDIASDLSIEKAFETVKASVGRIDVLINNAGAQYRTLSQLCAHPVDISQALSRTSTASAAKPRYVRASPALMMSTWPVRT